MLGLLIVLIYVLFELGLMVGDHESGKTTVLNQMKILYAGGFSDE